MSFSISLVRQVIIRIRALMEHGGLAYHPRAQLCTRTVKDGLLTKLLAPYNINYHIEHHLYPNVPGFRLPNVAKLISEKDKGLRVDANYVQAFFSIYRRCGKIS